MDTEWRKGPLGWSRMFKGHSLTVSTYNAFKGSGLMRKQVKAFCPRVDTTALASPAPCFPTLSRAQKAAEDFVVAAEQFKPETVT